MTNDEPRLDGLTLREVLAMTEAMLIAVHEDAVTHELTLAHARGEDLDVEEIHRRAAMFAPRPGWRDRAVAHFFERLREAGAD